MSKLAHTLKHVATKYNVPSVFSAPCELARLCKRINRKRRNEKQVVKRSVVCNTKTAKLASFTRFRSLAERCTLDKAPDV